MGQSPFSFVKWTMDCVTEQGDAVILYCSEIRWGRVHLVYTSALAVIGQQIERSSTLARFSLSSRKGQVCVEVPRLDISGRWEALASPFKHVVFENSVGAVIWEFIQPKSFVHVRAMDKEFTGIGYVERMTLTLPPWELSMRQFSKGRFVSTKDSLVWFDLQGEFSSRFALHNGVVCEPLSISATEIVLPEMALNMQDGVTLRSGSLGGNILPNAPTVGKLLPAKFFAVNQHLSKNPGALTGAYHSSTGWAIQEQLDWNS